jgi:hypothetical protein
MVKELTINYNQYTNRIIFKVRLGKVRIGFVRFD